MHENLPFNLDTNLLKNLSQNRAVEFFRKLLWAESSRVGIGRNLINVPDCINVGDGGIDAYIEDANPLFDDVIPKGTTGFQIKSSDLQPEECRKELHEKKELDKPLKREIKRILDGGGIYVLVLFADITNTKKQGRQQAIESEFLKFGYNNHFRVYTIDQLIGFAERFISLVTWLKPDLSQCLPYSAWGERRDIKIPNTFVPDEKRTQWINEIRVWLRKSEDTCPVFRIIGLSGIGKTRMAFETLSTEDIKNKVVYIPIADQFRMSTLYNTIQVDNSLNAILVIDDCDRQNHDDFVRSFSMKGRRLALITLSNDFARVSPPSNLFVLNPLGIQEIEKLIRAEANELPINIVHRLSEFADGYPRIATLLAESYITTAGTTDDFIRIGDDGLMDRLIGGKEVSQEDFKKYKRVLTGISLFQKIGYEDAGSAESKWLSEFINVDWLSFKEAVGYERLRGIIQGSYYISVTPFMLRVYLLNDWWEKIGFTKDGFNEFINSIPENFRSDLTQRFFDHIPYISSTERGRKFAKAMLGEEGVFSDGELLGSELGANFFIKLTEADPDAALGCLQRTVGRWSKDQLLQFTTGRREIVWALERIAVWRDLFTGAARILLSLGEAENESWSNNASGIFVELFSPGPGEVAPTEAPLEARFCVLEEAINADTKERRDLALRACDHALTVYHFTRMIGSENQGLRKTPKLWRPKTNQELFDNYRRVWRLLAGKLEDLSGDEQQKAINIILQNSREIGTIPHLIEMVIDTLKELIAKGYADETQVLAEVLEILHYDPKRIDPETTLQWEIFRDELSGTDFHALMRRYVKMDVLTDKFDEEGNIVDIVSPQIKKLAQQAINDKKLLFAELPWLVTTQAQNGFKFGYELGEVDKDYSLLSLLLNAQRNAGVNISLFFLSGYLNSLYYENEDAWEKTIEELVSDNKTASWVPELTWRSGFTEKAASRVLYLAKSGKVNRNQLRIFLYGGVIGKLSEKAFHEWIQYLLNTNDADAASLALGLYYSYYHDKKTNIQLPEELTFQLLTNPALFNENERVPKQTGDEYYWTELCKEFIEKYPNRAVELADVIIENFGKIGTILGDYYSRSKKILDSIAQKFPLYVWQKITKYLGPPIDTRAFHLNSWLNGDDSFGSEIPGALSIFPMEEIFKWVDEDIEKRAWYLASFVPKGLFNIEGKPCFVREVLIRYGERDDVLSSLESNLSSESWRGPASSHFQAKKEALIEFKKGETNKIILNWVDKYIALIDEWIEQERIREERRGY
jgi:hypothetical protein